MIQNEAKAKKRGSFFIRQLKQTVIGIVQLLTEWPLLFH
jgi:hypothetical protein